MALRELDLEKFKKKLLEIKSQYTKLVRNVSEDVKTPEESKGYSQHQADGGTDDFARNISLQVSDEEQKILRQIDRALEKIEEKTYGVCDLTGNNIPLPRLEAIPYATMTVEAQDMLEKGLFQ